MSTHTLYKTLFELTLLSLVLAACVPTIVEVPVTVVVEQTRVVSIAVTPTLTTAPPLHHAAPHPR